MDEAFIYLIKVNIALVVFYLFYRLLFSQDTFFVMRRFCLWIILGASFIYPLVTFSKKSKKLQFNKRLFNTHLIYFRS